MVEAGLRSLRWLVAMQTAPEGHFRPVGSHGFLMTSRNSPEPFDQQPLEACATIAACIAAKGVDPDSSWRAEAERAFAWFLGANAVGIKLAHQIGRGACRERGCQYGEIRVGRVSINQKQK